MRKIVRAIFQIFTEILGYLIKAFLFIFKNKLYRERFNINLKASNYYYWIHVASVGEFNAIKPLLKELENFGKPIFLTVMTKTGLQTALNAELRITAHLFPIDTPSNMKKIMNLINPQMIIIEETEFWPNMLFEAQKRKIKTIIVNGRISDNSFKMYHFTRYFWHYFDCPTFKICAQSYEDFQRFRKMGFSNVKICNNLKFSIKTPHFDYQTERKYFGFSATDKIIVFGSSRPEEENLIIKIFLKLKTKYSQLKLVIVPRHLNRLDEIKKLFGSNQFCILSKYQDCCNNDIMIVDKMGVLLKFYALSDIAIVGGSFFNFGGHNPVEPAIFSRPIIIGEFHNSCRDTVNKLLEQKAIIVSNKNKLEKDIDILLSSSDFQKSIGNNAFKVVKDNSGSLKLHLSELLSFQNENTI
jgi:3-deoxy-D-manno-octulosonic-acid transferase